jgi:outer membrane immunogenic protein
MKNSKLIFSVAVTVSAMLGIGAASAADLPLKAMPYAAPAPAFTWTGLYVGGNVGYSWGSARNDWLFFAENAVTPTPNCAPAIAGALCANGSDSNKLNGAIGGLQAGYNWQTGRYVAGIEADFQAAGQKGSQLFNPGYVVALGLPNGSISAADTQKLAWFGTLRGRLGLTADRLLFYATGGLAYGRVSVDGSATAIGSQGRAILSGVNSAPCVGLDANFFGQCPFASWSNGTTKVGWTLGGGVEGTITNNWSWKVEYLHVDLGTVSTTVAILPGCYGISTGVGAGCIPTRGGSGVISSRITDEIVRVGINYRFGPGPIVANY